MQALLTQLSHEHRDLHDHLQAIANAARKPDLANLVTSVQAALPALTTDLDEHIKREEEQAFPAIAAHLGEDMLQPFRDDHAHIIALRDTVVRESVQGRLSAGHCLELCERIEDHQEREDQMLFPSAAGSGEV